MNQKQRPRTSQLTFTHLLVTALVMLVVGYLFGRFSGPLPGDYGGGTQSSSATASNPPVADLASLEQSTRQSPNDAGVWEKLGNAYFDAGRYADAVDAYTRSIDIDAANPNVLTDRGIMYRRLGNPLAAADDFEAAAGLDPNHLLSRFNLGIVLYYDLNDGPGARAAFNDVLARNPSFVTPDGTPLKEFLANLP